METLYVNLYGASGSGKSTMAAELFAGLKNAGVVCELVREYVKEFAWQGVSSVHLGQFYIAAKQFRREALLNGKVECVVTDSPWLLAGYYGSYYDQEGWDESFAQGYQNLTQARQEHNVWVRRTKPYVQAGRYGSVETSNRDARNLFGYLKDKNVLFNTKVDSNESYIVFYDVMTRLGRKA